MKKIFLIAFLLALSALYYGCGKQARAAVSTSGSYVDPSGFYKLPDSHYVVLGGVKTSNRYASFSNKSTASGPNTPGEVFVSLTGMNPAVKTDVEFHYKLGSTWQMISDTLYPEIDAAISSRSTFSGGAVASVTAPVTVGTNNDKTGYELTSAYDAAKTAASQTSVNALPSASSIATAVWGAGTRSLTSFGSLVADTASAVWSAVTRTLTSAGAGGATAQEVWEYGTRTVTGGTVTASNAPSAAQIDAQLTTTHPGNWSATGGEGVSPQLGSNFIAAQGKDWYVARGDSAHIPFTIGRDLTGYSLRFGAKLDTARPTFAHGTSISPHSINYAMTNYTTGTGFINISSTWTNIATGKRYRAEVEARKDDEVTTVMWFWLWITQDVIR